MDTRRMLALAAFALFGLAQTSAQAGVGVSIGIGSPGYYRPYYGGCYGYHYYPYRVYVAPPPIYVVPRPVYVVPAPQPVYVQPAPGTYPPPPPPPPAPAPVPQAPQQPLANPM